MANKFRSKTEPFKHQTKALELSAMKKNFAYFMEMGCVDGDTEFLSNRGWVKFKDLDLKNWKRPLLVAEVVPGDMFPNNFNMAFVPPQSLIKKEVDHFIHMTGTGVDMMLTEDHDMVTRQHCTKYADNAVKRKSIYHLYKKANLVHDAVNEKPPKPYIKKHSFSIPTMCMGYDGVLGYEEQENDITRLTLPELRVMVAVMADGHFPNQTDNRCVVEFKKERKQLRFEKLCTAARLPFVKEKTKRGTVKYQIIAPTRTKVYDERFWVLDNRAKSTIFDEFIYWDGCVTKTDNYEQRRFYTNDKASADFIQHCCNINGFYSSIVTEMRKGCTKPNYVVYYFPSKDEENNIIASDEKSWKIIKNSEKVAGGTAYCFRVPSGYLLLRRNNKVFISGNSGKTKVMIDNMAYLYDGNHISGALVLAPKGVYRNWSEKEIPTHLVDDIKREVLVWKAEAGKSYKRSLHEAIANRKEGVFQILVFNIESLISKEGRELIDEFTIAHNSNVFALVDESTCIKNYKAKRTKAAVEIGKYCKIKRIATGSPITNSPLDLYGQMEFLNKSILGFGSFYAFRNTFAVIEKMQTRQGQHYDKILCYKNLDMLTKKLEPYSFRVTKKECLDLPEKVYITRDVSLTQEQIEIYKDMLERDVALYEGEEMSAQMALVKALRLHQVLCGSFTADDGTIHSIPNNRIDALLEVLEETSGKSIIWANYIKNITDIKEALTEAYGPESFVCYYGDVSDEDRVKAIQSFQDPNSPVRFFVGNTQTAGRGITLTEASTCIYFSNNFSLELRQQSEDRAHRIGQRNNVTYVDLVARATLDEKIIKALLQKRNISNQILQDELEEWIKL